MVHDSNEQAFVGIFGISFLICVISGIQSGMKSLFVLLPLVVIVIIGLYVKFIKGTEKEKSFPLVSIIILSIIGTFIFTGFGSCCGGLTKHSSRGTIEHRTKIHTDRGDRMPTIDESGEYHNAGTGERQLEYGGSREQQEDIDFADELIREGR